MIERLSLGDTIKVSGPKGKFGYKGNGIIKQNNMDSERFFTHLTLVAGGTGITPLFSIIKHIIGNPEDKTKISLLFSNKTEEDILLKKELDELAKNANFDVGYCLSSPGEEWDGLAGKFTRECLENAGLKNEDSHALLVCGTDEMVDAVEKLSKTMGLGKNNVFVF